uniref:BRCA1-associated RING domain protein 1-like n=1 Tax=Erigeron canadensis TaxID=72917 RepID=UPI001CB8B79E|nr:BRCA1-associated RING domain protein 1-like [Erigeron canadensis]
MADSNCSDPNRRRKNQVKYTSPKKRGEIGRYVGNLESNSRRASGAKSFEAKRQKKTDDRSHDTNDLASGDVATASGNSDTTFEKKKSCKNPSVILSKLDLKMSPCAFCRSSEKTEASGPMLAYAQGKEVAGNVANFSKVIHVHERCRNWTPRIFFKDGLIQNLESEVRRANRLKCSRCTKNGAGLGCYMETCTKTYHVPCALDICRWDSDDYLILCPIHTSCKFPTEVISKPRKQRIKSKKSNKNLSSRTTLLDAGNDLVFCGSDLSSDEKLSLVELASSNGAVVSKYWRDNVTHVIAATDSNGACIRTLKVLMAILNGKWIVNMQWVNACREAGHPVKEEPYEVQLDNYGCSGGPKAGRLRLKNNVPKLFNNMKFYFVGDFVEAYKSDFTILITTAGGIVSKTKEQLLSSLSYASTGVKVNQVTLVIYNADTSDCSLFQDKETTKSQRLASAQDIAQEYAAHVVAHTWILESVAACSLLPFTSRA